MEEMNMESKQMHCTNCGKEMSQEAEICTSCGVRQGKVIHYCYNCGNEIQPNQELCLGCGVNPRKIKRQSVGKSIESTGTGSVNVVLAAILGFFIPGLPSLLWYNQKTKGIVMIVAAILVTILLPLLGLIVVIVGAIDAYQLGQRVNNGETLDEWTFFWMK